jgi:maleylpyruvate isomerase
MLKLYNYYRSSASFRVRIALNYKNLSYEYLPVHLIREGGEQYKSDFQAINPQSLIPVLQEGDQIITQSLAILEYLEETHPTPALLPKDPIQRAQIRAFAQAIVSEMHPVNNSRVLNYLKDELKVDEDEKLAWYHHWLQIGFTALEKIIIQNNSGLFCFGAQLSFADICLIPQIRNAYRFNFAMDAFPRLMKIYEHCLSLDCFVKAQPEQQPDAE